MNEVSVKLYEQLSYPKHAKENSIEGRVQLKFMIDKTGHVRKAAVYTSDHEELSDAALEALYKASPFNLPPGENGKNQDVWFILPINFKLSDDKETKLQASNINKREWEFVEDAKLDEPNLSLEEIATPPSIHFRRIVAN